MTAPEDASPGQYDLAGLIGFQTCTDKICLPPSGAKFEGAVTVGQAIQQGKVPLAFQKGDYSLAAKEAKRQFQNQDSETGQAKQIAGDADAFFANLKPTKVEYSFIWALLFAFAGGFLLNFMPCVLPVIGLKVMAFVQQAGENRARVFWLNFWYAAGMMSIFLVVATLVVVFNFGLGQWLQTTAFRVTLTAIMFAMGLSFLGVWEIPIPGFVGAGGAGKLAAQEGPVGAFSKGVLTTILGTACTGPGIASAFAWCSGKPAFLVYAVFVFMGLGMVFPYLAIGVRPQLIRFLPKPGAWMETFKQIMGFVLLATVVLLLTFLHMTMVIPTIAVLFAVWAACWWTARTAYNADLHAKVRSWCGACALVAIVVMFSFGWLYGEMERRFAGAVEAEMAKHGQETPELVSQLAWKPYSKQKLHSLLTDGKTVMVDFTADWCMTCKLLEATVLNTQSIKEQIEKNGVETLVADWTERGPEIGNTLVNLGGGKQVPTLAIFPASRPDSPIVITGLYTKAQLLKKLEEAGPSQTLTASPEASSPKAASLARAPK